MRAASEPAAVVANLRAHPADADGPVSAISVRVTRTKDAVLDLAYVIRGDLERIRVPVKARSRIGRRLWEHTCCELFVRAQGAGTYRELNFSPSGEWTAYAFDRYRDGGPLDDEALDPSIALSANAGVLELAARVPLGRLLPADDGSALALGIAAVIEAHDGARSHWALIHPAPRPDFHHADAFALKLDAIRD